MTESEWLASEDAAAMVYYLAGGSEGMEGNRSLWRTSERKFRLFAVASARLRPDCHRFRNPAWLESIRIAELVADGLPMPDDRPKTALDSDLGPTRIRAIDAARTMCSITAGMSAPEAHLLRDIVGNPFRPYCVRWSGGPIPYLAQAAYDNRDPSTGHLDPVRLAVLADALEEAGCEDERLLKHLRPGEVVGFSPETGRPMVIKPGTMLVEAAPTHVRGCWVLDLVLGKK